MASAPREASGSRSPRSACGGLAEGEVEGGELQFPGGSAARLRELGAAGSPAPGTPEALLPSSEIRRVSPGAAPSALSDTGRISGSALVARQGGSPEQSYGGGDPGGGRDPKKARALKAAARRPTWK